MKLMFPFEIQSFAYLERQAGFQPGLLPGGPGLSYLVNQIWR